jgi:hypothetical protein
MPNIQGEQMTNLPEQISRENVVAAIAKYKNGDTNAFGPSTTYDVIYRDNKYPPKAIIGLASNLGPTDFNGGQDTECFNILNQLGFRIVMKDEERLTPLSHEYQACQAKSDLLRSLLANKDIAGVPSDILVSADLLKLDSFDFSPYNFSRCTPKGLFTYDHFMTLLLATIAVPLYRELDKYKKLLEEVTSELGTPLRKWADKNFDSDRFAHTKLLQEAKELIDQDNNLDAHDARQLTLLLETDEPWGGRKGKGIGRVDYCKSTACKCVRLLHENATSFSDLAEELCDHPKLVVKLDAFIDNQLSDNDQPSYGENVILHGAPGTGKSFELENNGDYFADKTYRTVFHAETQYVDFVGCVRPVSVAPTTSKSQEVTTPQSSNNDIGYGFVGGPFTEAIIWSRNNPKKRCRLIIEEINRAPAASAFGEIFQLLDRDPKSRESCYPIHPIDLLRYVNENVDCPIDGITIPGNMSIYATMNNSDQNVTPLDTAFKRRWKFKYLPVTFDNKYPQGIVFDNISWKDFAERINQLLKSGRIPEDRLLGQYFVTEHELNDANTVREKVIPYLFNDVLRYDYDLRKQIFSVPNSLSDLLSRHDEIGECFNAIFDDSTMDVSEGRPNETGANDPQA